MLPILSWGIQDVRMNFSLCQGHSDISVLDYLKPGGNTNFVHSQQILWRGGIQA